MSNLYCWRKNKTRQYLSFAKEIIKNSKVKLFLVKNNYELAKFLKNNIYGKKIVVGMGARTISIG